MGCQAVKMLFEFDTELLLRLKTEKLYQSAESFVADGMEVLKDEEQQELNRLLDLIKTVPENACKYSGKSGHCFQTWQRL